MTSRNNIGLFLIIVCTLLTTRLAFSQSSRTPPSFIFENYSKTDGLNQSSTNAIFQDSEDMLWIGNFGGINRFDGYEFESYVNKFGDSTTISDDVIWTFVEDHQNNLWIGTKNGLNLYDRKTGVFKSFKPVNKSTSLAIKAILKTDGNNLIVGTEGNGLYYFNTIDYTFSGISEIPKSKITCIEESNSSIWIGTEKQGLYEFIKSSKKVISHLKSGGLKAGFIKSLHLDNDSNLWIGTDQKGLFYQSINNKTISKASSLFKGHYAGDRIQAIASDHRNRIWIGSATNGLTIYDKKNKNYYHYKYMPGIRRTIADNDISSIHVGSNNVIYLGYYQKGFDKVVETPFYIIENNPSNPYSLSHNNVYSLLHDSRGRLWVGTYGGGLNLLQENFPSRFKHFKHDPTDPESISHDWIRFLFEDSKGRLWIGTWGGGLNVYDEKLNRFKRYKHNPKDSSSLSMNTVEVVFEDSKGSIWIGTYGEGINIYQPEKDNFYHLRHDPNNFNSLSDDHITAFHEDKNGYIWISTYGGGLNRYDPKLGDFDRFIPDPKNPHSLNDHKVLFIFEEKDEDYFWLTTLGGGLNKMNQNTGEFTHYTIEDGLPNNTTIGMLKTSANTYWINTNNGLTHFFPKEDKFINYTISDGLGSDDYNLAAFTKDSHGNFYFGGKQGLTYFHPDSVKKSISFPKLAITSLQIGNKNLNISAEIDIPYGKRLVVQTAAINPSLTKKIRYSYQFDGDDEWFPLAQDRTLELVSLEAGDHIVKVRSTNSDGVWNPNPVSLGILVIPPWYQTTTFKLICGIMLITGFITFYKIRLIRLKRQRLALQLIVKERTQTISQKNKDLQTAIDKQSELERFKEGLVSMVAHDLKNPLVSILSRSSVGKKLDIKHVNQSGRQMLRLIENMLDILKFEDSKIKLNKSHFFIGKTINAALKEMEPVAEENGIQLINCMADEYLVEADQQLIRRVLNNLISNAIKYSSYNSKIEIYNSVQSGNIIISIKDYGEGIPSEDLDRIFEKFQQNKPKSLGAATSTGLGLSFCKLVMKAHNQKLEVNSKLGEGSEFSFSIPVIKKDSKIQSTTFAGEISFPFRTEDYDLWQTKCQELLKLEIYEAGQWSEVLDELVNKGTGTKQVCDQVMGIITRYDQEGITLFKEKLAEFLSSKHEYQSK
ncbi:ligand-binding sensor domain-containing protein [Ekhidna sp.]|uniref:ligand-binding sensor domain-containing protein n=1 Tax=Ekhidna sp. TaxID=2608089 RepID=UPI003B5143D6